MQLGLGISPGTITDVSLNAGGPPLGDAGDVNCGWSVPPSGMCFFEVQMERVGENLPAILEL